MSLTLYIDRFWISPYAFSCFVALEEKKIPFEVKEIGLDKKDHWDPAYRKSSLTGRIPALEHDGFWLTESNAIDDYLEDAFPPPQNPRLFPADIREKARARQLMAWVRSDLMPIREERATHTMFYARAKDPLSEKGRAAAETLLQAADLLVPEDRPYLFETWSIADADFAFMLMRLILNGHPVPAPIKTYAETQWARPSIQKWVTHTRPAYVAY